jgi:hypothetical protein
MDDLRRLTIQDGVYVQPLSREIGHSNTTVNTTRTTAPVMVAKLTPAKGGQACCDIDYDDRERDCDSEEEECEDGES